MKGIVVENAGGPEVLVYKESETPKPKAGEALVKIAAIGVNYIDVYHRTGLYKLPTPFIPGSEAAGTVEALGDGFTDVAIGERVAYAMVPGAYAEYAAAPADKLVKIPDGVDFATAAAALLQGMTAHYLVTSTYQLKAGDAALVHAAAGGVGLLLIQMAKKIGARVFGTVSTDEKAKLARDAGTDHVILYTKEDFEAEIKRLTEGRGLQVRSERVSLARCQLAKKQGWLARPAQIT